ncbi:hypothetical protein APR41_14610 [Salegentibacter salinarum]|uniref:Uncharacterized protein n=1 Tax=Salegentibacter salinarum TaxID=447422 RepID=A0A2N0TZP0_9FLAO|nr:hypothetical protein [Salegentibacter salinarum]PKD20211.1 hypothetical protein APR41_14610 [Salegentibacter salinarum]SKB87257.1 hypothetical protein SAMN05660903_02975 [Salegentibacter salinarum]
MIIYYPQKRLKYKLLYGIVSVIIGSFAFIIDSEPIFIYPWVILGFLEIGTWYYEKKYHYLHIDHNILTKNSLFPKSIDLRQVTAIRKNRNSFVLESEGKNIRIHKGLVASQSLNQLTDLLDEIQLQPQHV